MMLRVVALLKLGHRSDLWMLEFDGIALGDFIGLATRNDLVRASLARNTTVV